MRTEMKAYFLSYLDTWVMADAAACARAGACVCQTGGWKAFAHGRRGCGSTPRRVGQQSAGRTAAPWAPMLALRLPVRS